MKQRLLSEKEIIQEKTLQYEQQFVFLATFLLYAAIHSSRSTWAYSKPYMDLSQSFLGWADFVFLVLYGLAMQFGGSIGDRIPIKHFLILGLIPTTLFVVVLAYIGSTGFYNETAILFIMGLNGIAQSSLWPGLLAIMGGLLIGVWSCNSNFGAVQGLLVSEILIQYFNYHWSVSMYISGFFLLGFSALLWFRVYPQPRDIGLSLQQQDIQFDIENSKEILRIREKQMKIRNSAPKQHNYIELEAIQQQERESELIKQDHFELREDLEKLTNFNFMTVWKIPKVFEYSMTFGCIQGSYYGLLFWLPYYLNEQTLSNYSGSISSMNQVGHFLSGMIAGHISDQFGVRALTIMPLMVIGSLLMLVIQYALDTNPIPYYFVMFFTGLCIGGPYSLICGAISIDLSKQPLLKNSPQAISTITSTIEGVGSLVAALLQVIIPYLGLKQIFTLMIFLFIISIFILRDMAQMEYQEFKKQNFR